MRSLISRLHNKYTIPSAASIIAGLVMATALAVLSNSGWTTAVQARWFIWVGVGLVAVGLALGISGFLRTSVPESVRLYGIIPLLDKYMTRLWALACEEADRRVDWEQYGQVNDRFNVSILQVNLCKSGSAKPAQRRVGAVKDELYDTRSEKRSIPEIVRALQEPSAFLDSSGFGLKTLRENDATLKRLRGKLAKYRDLSADEHLKVLLRCHEEFAEYSASMILAFHRGLWARAYANVGTSDSVQTQYRGELELTESSIAEAGYAITSEISQLIRQLQHVSQGRTRPSDKDHSLEDNR